MSKITRIPISYRQRKLNEYGPGYVPCEISERWLQFDLHSGVMTDGREFINVEVMTNGKDDQPYRICELVVTRHDLERALGAIKPKTD